MNRKFIFLVDYGGNDLHLLAEGPAKKAAAETRTELRVK